MARRIFIAVLLIAAIATYANAAERLYFKGTDKDKDGNSLELRGKLIRPDGNGPFPAVVLLHQCLGILMDLEGAAAEKLASWGYVTLQVDSFIPRATGIICGNPGIIPPHTRVLDAYDAKSFLAGLPYIDRNRIAVMGWGHGGGTALCAVSWANYTAHALMYKDSPANRIIDEKVFSSYPPFQAAVAFYPPCAAGLGNSNAPLLLLTGELDTLHPANLCMKHMPSGKPSKEVILKVYPKAVYGFDYPSANNSFREVFLEHRVAYQPEASADAYLQIKGFLSRHLK